MEDEIIEALSEWPVTNSVYDQTSPLDKIDNPNSVSTFFLRNVRKTKTGKEKVIYIEYTCKFLMFHPSSPNNSKDTLELKYT